MEENREGKTGGRETEGEVLQKDNILCRKILRGLECWVEKGENGKGRRKGRGTRLWPGREER